MELLPRLPKGLNMGLVKDLCRKLNTVDILEWIEERASNLAKLGYVGSSVEFTPNLLREVGVSHYEYSDRSLGTSRLLVTEKGAAIIQYHSYRGLSDKRFWIAHELAHLMWRDRNNLNLPLSPIENSVGSDPTIEWLCNRFAAALLVPRLALQKSGVHLSPPNAKDVLGYLLNIKDLALRFNVPERLVARRIYHDIGGLNIGVISIRVGEGEGPRRSGKVEWEAIPRYNLNKLKPRKLYGRRIPSAMLPIADIIDGEIDSRWGLLIQSAFSKGRAKPLKYALSEEGSVAGSVHYITEGGEISRCIVAVFLEDLVR